MSLGDFINSMGQASFKGVPFFIKRETHIAGQKQADHDYIGSDRKSIEPLGKLPEVVQLSAQVMGNDFEANYKNLKKAIEEPTAGILKTSLLNDELIVVARPATFTHARNRVGVIEVELEFSQTSADPRPIQDTINKGVVKANRDKVYASCQEYIASSFDVSQSDPYSRIETQSKVEDAFSVIKEKNTTQSLDEDVAQDFNRSVEIAIGDTPQLINDPSALAISFTSIMGKGEVISITKENQFSVSVSLFDYGGDDALIPTNTFYQQERKRNNETINISVNVMALASAYNSAAQVSYTTTDDVDLVSDALESQYSKYRSIIPDTSLRQTLDDLRSEFNKFLSQVRIRTGRVLEIETGQKSAKMLSYQYYGNTDREQEIVKLNGLLNPSELNRITKIVSEV